MAYLLLVKGGGGRGEVALSDLSIYSVTGSATPTSGTE